MADQRQAQPSAPHYSQGAFLTVGYNAWHREYKGEALDKMMGALEDNGVDILVDTRGSDKKSRYSYQQLAEAAGECMGNDGKPMRFVPRPALTGMPRDEQEFTADGRADYEVMDQRPAAKKVLDGIAASVQEGKRVAVLCACDEVCTCHRTRWLAESMYDRGIVAQHLEPGSWRDRGEEVKQVEWHLSSHEELRGQLPHYSDTNWQERMAGWGSQPKSTPAPAPDEYESPVATKALPEKPRVVLIAGSMNANAAQLNYASDLVVRAAELGAQIRVGDNDKGVDARVVETANAIGYENVQVWTAEKEPRNGGVEGGTVVRVPYTYQRGSSHGHDEKWNTLSTVPEEVRVPYPQSRGGNQWTQRDRAMINSVPDDESVCMFLSNGQTHYQNGRLTGTEAGYVHAINMNKPVMKVDFNQPRHRQAALKPLPATYNKPDYLGALREADLALEISPQVLPDLPEFQPLDLGSDDDAAVKALRHQPREAGWQYAAAQAEAKTQSQTRMGLHATAGRGAATFDLETVPAIGEENEKLGYAVIGVQCHWRESRFALPTHDWSTADTVRATGIAHFHDHAVAREYENSLRGFMDDHNLRDDPLKAAQFAGQVGEINRLPPGGNTLTFTENNIGVVPESRQQISALQAGLWAMPVEPDFRFKPQGTAAPPMPPHETDILILEADPAANASQMKMGRPTYYFCVDEQGLSAQKVWAAAGQRQMDRFEIFSTSDREAAEQEARQLAHEGQTEGLALAMKMAADAAMQRGLISEGQPRLFSGPDDPFKTEAQERLERQAAISQRRERMGEADEPAPDVAGSADLTSQLASLAGEPYEPMVQPRRLYPSHAPYVVSGLPSVTDIDEAPSHPSDAAAYRLHEERVNGVTYGLEVRQVYVASEQGQLTDQYATLDLTKEWDQGQLNFHIDPAQVQDGENRLALKIYQAQTGIDLVRHAEALPLEHFGDTSTPEGKKEARQAQRNFLERMSSGVPSETPDQRLRMNLPFEIFENGMEAIGAGQQLAERWQAEGLASIMQHASEQVSPHLYMGTAGVDLEQGRLFAYGPADPLVRFDLERLPDDAITFNREGIYHPDRSLYLRENEPDYALQVHRVPGVDGEGQFTGLRYELLAQKCWFEDATSPVKTENVILHSFQDRHEAFGEVAHIQANWQQDGLEIALDQALERYCPPGAKTIPAGELFRAGPRDNFEVPDDAALLQRHLPVQEDASDDANPQKVEPDFQESMAQEALEKQQIKATRMRHLDAISALGINPEPFNPLSPDAHLPAIQQGEISAWVTFYQPDAKEDYAIAGILTTYPDEHGKMRAAIAPCVEGDRESVVMASGKLVELAHEAKNLDHFFCAANDMEVLNPQTRVQWDSGWGKQVPIEETDQGYNIEWSR